MTTAVLRAVGLLVLVCAVLPAQALYKVVGPDGRVTYTDRPPAGVSPQQVSPVTPGALTQQPADAALPFDLRQAAARYPVTFYVSDNCAPCDTARALLRGRGVPHTEKLVASNEDADALQRLVGTRDTPTLTVGTQPLRGFSAELWNFYLDSAGYPRQSRLPAGWRYAPATPVVERRKAVPAEAASQPQPAASDSTVPEREPAPSPGGIRF